MMADTLSKLGRSGMELRSSVWMDFDGARERKISLTGSENSRAKSGDGQTEAAQAQADQVSIEQVLAKPRRLRAFLGLRRSRRAKKCSFAGEIS